MEVICTICSSDLVSEHEEVISTPCRHVFHKQCLSAWLAIAERCPICTSSVSENSISKSLFLSSIRLSLLGQPQEELEKQVLGLQRKLASNRQSLKEAKLANTCLIKREEYHKKKNALCNKSIDDLKSEIEVLKLKMQGVQSISKKNAILTQENEMLRQQLQETNLAKNRMIAKYKRYKAKSANLQHTLDNTARKCHIEHVMRKNPKRC